MADGEAPGEARLDDPVDGPGDPVDTDRLAVDQRTPVDTAGEDAQFGYLLDADHHDSTTGLTEADEPAVGFAEDPYPQPEWVEPPPPTEAEEKTFDAFDARTWNFTPAPMPWYRTGPTAAVV
ncbi:MAG: hypothetical protein M3O32_16950, partial [Actinomycetota bacterium]|nr:hypothetical protein [Actinomycetota bacterium]